MITLDGGLRQQLYRHQVHDEVMASLVPWLNEATVSGAMTPIPGTGGYQAQVLPADGALVVTVFAPEPDIGESMPLASFGVATQRGHADTLWPMLTRLPGVLQGIEEPELPWCGTYLYSTLYRYPDAIEWIRGFEGCIAWAWASRNPGLQAVR